MSAYDEGRARMAEALREQRPNGSRAFGMLADLRIARQDLVPGSAEWMEQIGQTVTLLHAFPHLADPSRHPRMGRVSRTKPVGLRAAGVE